MLQIKFLLAWQAMQSKLSDQKKTRIETVQRKPNAERTGNIARR